MFWTKQNGVLKIGPGCFVGYGQEFDEGKVDKDVLEKFMADGDVSDVNPNPKKQAPKKVKKDK